MIDKKDTGGWIKLWRKLLHSQMYKSLNAKQRDVLIQCLLLSNHEKKQWEWQGEIFEAKPGQFITSINSLVELSAYDTRESSVKTALKKLELWKFLTNESTKTGRLITILNWERYQLGDFEGIKAIDKGLTTNKKEKKEKKYNNIEERKKKFTEEVESFGDSYNSNMLGDFIRHWTEENKTGTKMKFEMQSTWSMKGRLTTWKNNAEKWNPKNAGDSTGGNEKKYKSL